MKAEPEPTLGEIKAMLLMLHSEIGRLEQLMRETHGKPHVSQVMEDCNVIRITNLIMREVCAFYGVSADDIRSRARPEWACKPRHVAWYLIEKHTGISRSRIGRMFDKRIPSTIWHGIEDITNRIQYNGCGKEVAEIEAKVVKQLEEK